MNDIGVLYVGITLFVGFVSLLLAIIWGGMYSGLDWERRTIKTAFYLALTCWAWPVWVLVLFGYGLGGVFSVFRDDRKNK